MSEDSNKKARGSDSKFVIRHSPFAIHNSQFEIECPFCHGTDVELFSLFGSQLLTSEYYCRNCRTVFEQVKR